MGRWFGVQSREKERCTAWSVDKIQRSGLSSERSSWLLVGGPTTKLVAGSIPVQVFFAHPYDKAESIEVFPLRK